MRRVRQQSLHLCLFDVLYCAGFDLRRTPLIDRKELLKQIVASAPKSGVLIYSDHVIGKGEALFEHACNQGLEGTISKRIDAEYVSGRTTTWLKKKCTHRQEFVIGG